MIREFELWSAARTESSNLSDLFGCCLAIEADFYLDRLLNHSSAKEPLLPALGGTPFSFQTHVEHELLILKEYSVKPIFIFSGLDVGKDYTPFAHGNAVANANAEAWDLYNRHEATEAVNNFGNSGYATARRYYTLLQQLLREQKVEYQVAPYSALGQLAYLSRNAPEHVDAIAGSTDLLLFDVEKVITSIDFPNVEITYVRRQQCIDELNITHSEMFTDACMLSGCSLLPTLPALSQTRMPKIPEAVNLLKQAGQNGNSVYSMIEKDQRNIESDYLDRYKRGRLAVKHDVIMTTGGKVEPMASEDVPNDLHDIIGQRLPDELYYYLSVGTIGARMLNQLTSARIYEDCPADGGESEVYKVLVSERLTSIRALSLSLLAFRLHRVYQHRMIQLSTWYAPDRHTSIDVNDRGDPNEAIKDWRFLESTYPQGLDFDGSDASLASALKAVSDSSFTSKPSETKTRLQSSTEVKGNTLWRFLHFRGYLDKKRALTPWGETLSTMISALPLSSGQEEAVVLAAELLKLDLLNSENMFPRYTGAPMHGSDVDKSNTLLLARVACLGKLNHKAIGFTGPLSRHLLAYGCLIEAVRANIRDLLEISLVSMLLSGHATRERNDLTDITMDLPFLLPLDCALGIAMKHYLDDVNGAAASHGSVAPEMMKEAKERGPRELFPHVNDFKGDLEKGFKLWDAIFAGVKVACDNKLLAKNDKAYWEGVDKWVQERR